MPKHGCTRPFDELQMVSWVVFPLFVVAFSCLCVPPLPMYAQFLLSIPFGLVVVGLSYFAAKTTLSDSGDPQVYYGHQLQKDPEKNMHWTSYCVEGSKKCHVCKVHRQPLSEHCRVCKKCVETFDHHCKWLNNCIGSQNYYGFFVTLTLATLQVCSHFIVVLGELIAYGASTTFQTSVVVATRNSGGEVVWLVLQSVCGVLLGVFGYLLFDLFKFHITLIQHDDTTFGYFKARNRREVEDRKRKKLQQEVAGGAAVFPAEFELQQEVAGGTVCAAICFPCFPTGAPNKLPKWIHPLDKEQQEKEDTAKVVKEEVKEVATVVQETKVPSNAKADGQREAKVTTDSRNPSPVTVEFINKPQSMKNKRGKAMRLGLTGVIKSSQPREKDGMIEMVLDWTLANDKHAVVYSREIEVY
jgi:hypothetical protein